MCDGFSFWVGSGLCFRFCQGLSRHSLSKRPWPHTDVCVCMCVWEGDRYRMCVCSHMCTEKCVWWCLLILEEGLYFLYMEIQAAVSVPSWGLVTTLESQEPNLDPLYEQSVLLTTEPSISPDPCSCYFILFFSFLNSIIYWIFLYFLQLFLFCLFQFCIASKFGRNIDISKNHSLLTHFCVFHICEYMFILIPNFCLVFYILFY